MLGPQLRWPEREARRQRRLGGQAVSDFTKGILLDIEGTTSSITFVYDQMFPFVRRELSTFLRGNQARRDVRDAMEALESSRSQATSPSS